VPGSTNLKRTVRLRSESSTGALVPEMRRITFPKSGVTLTNSSWRRRSGSSPQESLFLISGPKIPPPGEPAFPKNSSIAEKPRWSQPIGIVIKDGKFMDGVFGFTFPSSIWSSSFASHALSLAPKCLLSDSKGKGSLIISPQLMRSINFDLRILSTPTRVVQHFFGPHKTGKAVGEGSEVFISLSRVSGMRMRNARPAIPRSHHPPPEAEVSRDALKGHMRNLVSISNCSPNSSSHL
jgi:hypothetical protein